MILIKKMAAGISSYLANKLLDRATGKASFTMPSGVYAKMHTGNPGAAATANASAQATRVAATFASAASGSIAADNMPEFTLTATETITQWICCDLGRG